MTKLHGSTAWVIGASSGIGAATAQELTRRGARVVISARRRDKLVEVAGDRMEVVPLDVTDLDAVSTAWAEVQQLVGIPDLVLVSAGMWDQTKAGTFDAAEFRKHIDVHLVGLGNVLDPVVPALVSRGSGTIAVVASVAGYRGLSGGEYYGAVKAAQINLMEGLRASLSKRGIAVVTICPGFVDTDLVKGNSFPMPFMISPEEAAADICDGLEKDRQEIVFPTRMAALMKTARLLPVSVWNALASRLTKN